MGTGITQFRHNNTNNPPAHLEVVMSGWWEYNELILKQEVNKDIGHGMYFNCSYSSEEIIIHYMKIPDTLDVRAEERGS